MIDALFGYLLLPAAGDAAHRLGFGERWHGRPMVLGWGC